MTAPEQRKEKTAAALFAGFMAVALGGAGLLIAALAVGIESAWNGSAGDRADSSARRASWLANERAWLAADHRARQGRADAYGNWLTSGADPASEPGRPSLWRRLGTSIHRGIARTAIAGADFWQGARRGYQMANAARRDGATPAQILRTRPCYHCRTVPAVERGLCGDCAGAITGPAGATLTLDDYKGTSQQPPTPMPEARRSSPRPQPQPKQDAPAPDGLSRLHADIQRTKAERPTPTAQCRHCGHTRTITPSGWCEPCTSAVTHGFCGRCKGVMRLDGDYFVHGSHWPCWAVVGRGGSGQDGPGRCPNCRRAGVWRNGRYYHDGRADEVACTYERHDRARQAAQRSRIANGSTSQNPEGVAMTTTTQPAQTPTTESNASVLRSKLAGIDAALGQISELTDRLAAARGDLDGKVSAAEEFATSTGQSAQTRQAMDEARALASQMGQHLGGFSDGAAGAQDQVTQASAGLRVAEAAHDSLQQAGATHRAVAPAGADA